MSILRSFWLLVGTVIALTGSAHSQTIPPYLPPNGLIGWWPFNGNATDESFGNNDGTPVGAIRTTDRFGAIGSAYEFDGVNDYIALANPVDVGQGSFTISLYCRAQRWGDGLKESYIFGIPFIHDYDSVFQGFRFVNLAGRPLINNRVPAVNKNSFEVAIGDGRQSESYVVTQQPVFDGVWYHLVMVFNRELHTLSLFVDGQLVGVDPVDASFLDIDLGVAPTIGCQRAGYRVNSFFKGKIDDLAVWNRALSAEEIAFLHHACDFSILTQPLDAKVVQGQGATLTVVTSATNSATYRWQYQQGDDFVDLVNGADFSGVNTSSLAIQSVDSALAGRYRCEITQDDCRVFSDVVRVSLVSSDIQSYVPQSGLIGWWPFDGNASDHSGNENHGVVSGAILTNDQQGERRRAYELDGVDDFISVPWSESLAELEQKNAFTVSAWVKNYGDAPIGVFGMQHPSDDCGGWEIRTASNYLDIWFTCGSMVPCYPALPSLEWHHIAVTYASNGSTGTWRFYLNGVQACSSSGFSGAVPTTQGGTLYVGASPLGDDEFGYGALDEIGVWNRALTDEEIRDLHTRCLAITAQPVSALGRSDGVAYFTVEARSKEPILYQWQRLTDVGFVNLSNGGGISGSTTASLVMAPFSSSLTGTYRCIVSTAACSFVSDTVTAALLGRRESSCIFNSGDPNPWPNPIQSQAGYITLGDLGTPSAFSVSLWVKPEVSQHGIAVLLDCSHAGSANWVIQSLDGGVSWEFLGTAFTLATDRWQHLLCTYSNGVATVFVDGVEIDQSNQNIVWGESQLIHLGNWPEGGRRFKGQVDEVLITRNVLSTNSVVPKNQIRIEDVPPGSLGLWHFDEGSGTSTKNEVSNSNVALNSWTWSPRVLNDCDVVIASQPSNGYIRAQAQGTLSVEALADSPVSYQWQRRVGSDFVNLVPGNEYSGVTEATLVLTSFSASLQGDYRCIVSTAGCSIQSNQAELLVLKETESSCLHSAGNPNPGASPSPKRGGFIPLGNLGQTSQFSVSVWVRPEVTEHSDPILLNCTNGQGRDIWRIQSHDYGATWTFAGANFALEPDAWQHLLCTYGENWAKVFVNGELVGQYPTTLIPSWVDSSSLAYLTWNVYLGNSPHGGHRFSGQVDELLITRNVLHSSTFVPKNQLQYKDVPPGSLGLWNFDEGLGPVTRNAVVGTDYDINGWTWSPREKSKCEMIIAEQPRGGNVQLAQQVSLHVEALSTSVLAYQWQKRVDTGFINVVDVPGFDGATTPTLSIDAFAAEHADTYRCIVTTPECTLISDTITLTIIAAEHSACLYSSGDPNPSPYPSPARGGYLQLGSLGAPQAFSVSMWVKPDPVQHDVAILIDCSHEGSSNWVIQTTNGGMSWNFLGATFSLETQEWQHLLCTYANGVATVYVNGVEVDASRRSVAWNEPQRVYLGNWKEGGRRFQGLVDDLLITRNVLHSGPFIPLNRTAIKDVPEGALGLWHFDEGHGTLSRNEVSGSNVNISNWTWASRADSDCDLVVSSQPQSGYIPLGKRVNLSVETLARSVVSYQWQRKTATGFVSLVDGASLSGVTTSVLTIDAMAAENQGVYRCRVSTASCSVSSDTASINLLGSDESICLYNAGSPNPDDAPSPRRGGFIHLGNMEQTTQFSVSLWVKPAVTEHPSPMLIECINWTRWNGWRIRSSDYGASWTFLGATFTLDTSSWQHLLCTYDNGVAKVYVNGLLVQEDSRQAVYVVDSTSQVSPMWEIYLGNSPAGGQRFKGQVDDIIITRNVLKGESFVPRNTEPLQGLTTDAVGLWSLDEGIGKLTRNKVSGEDQEINTWTWAARKKSCEITIIKHPESVYLSAGEQSSLATQVIAFSPLSYQWQRQTTDGFVDVEDDDQFSGSSTQRLVIKSFSNQLTGLYRCRVSTEDCSFLTKEARVRLEPSNVPMTGLVGWWPLDGHTNDESGYNNHGVSNGATSHVDRYGYSNSSYSFDGYNDYISIPWSPSLGQVEQNEVFTVSLWVKNQHGGYFGLFNMQHPTNDCGGWELLSYGDYYIDLPVRCEPQLGQVPNEPCSPVLPMNEWVNVVYTHDGETDQYKLYVNGKEACSGGISAEIPSTEGGVLYLGYSPLGDDEYSYGQLDDVCIWNRALTFDEVQGLYDVCDIKIAEQPSNLTVKDGQFAVLSVSVLADYPVRYQWQRQVEGQFVNIYDDVHFLGATTSTLQIESALESRRGPYRCVITYGTCSVVSNEALLTIDCQCGSN